MSTMDDVTQATTPGGAKRGGSFSMVVQRHGYDPPDVTWDEPLPLSVVTVVVLEVLDVVVDSLEEWTA